MYHVHLVVIKAFRFFMDVKYGGAEERTHEGISERVTRECCRISLLSPKQ